MDIKGIVFDDEFEAEEGDICFNCGSESENLIGWNEDKYMSKLECSNCNIVSIVDENTYERHILEGDVRDWETFLQDNLSFPFEAIVDECSDREFFGMNPGPIKYKDRLIVNAIEMDDEFRGIIVEVKKKGGRRKFYYPLCDLDTVDKTSINYKLVNDYRVWDANCR